MREVTLKAGSGPTKKARKSHRFTGFNYKWCRLAESNCGHRDFQSLALPTELKRHTYFSI